MGEKKKECFLSEYTISDFEVVFRRYYRQMYLYAYNFVMDEMEAEDIVQETFSIIWERREKLPGQLNIQAYLYAAVRHACLKYFRRLKLTDQYQKRQVEALLLSFTYEEDEIHEEEEVIRAVRSAMDTLTEQQARIVRMHVSEGLTYHEIADQLNLSDNTVRTHLKRGYKILREHLSCFFVGFFIFS